MLDNHETRLWADHHRAFGDWVQHIAGEIHGAFKVLVRIQYAAPWQASDAGRPEATAAPALRTDEPSCLCRA